MYIRLTKTRVFVAAVLLLGALSIFAAMAHWDGAFDVPVTVHRNGKVLSSKAVKRVSYHAYYGRRDITDEVLSPDWLEDARHESGRFIARAYCSGTRSWLGLELSYQQSHMIYVEIELADGRVVKLSCPLAHRKHNPQIQVDVGTGERKVTP